MMKVLALLDEDSVITKCVLGLQECSEENPCPKPHQYKLIKPQLIDLFENKTIEDLLKELDKTSITLGNKLSIRKKKD